MCAKSLSLAGITMEGCVYMTYLLFFPSVRREGGGAKSLVLAGITLEGGVYYILALTSINLEGQTVAR